MPSSVCHPGITSWTYQSAGGGLLATLATTRCLRALARRQPTCRLRRPLHPQLAPLPSSRRSRTCRRRHVVHRMLQLTDLAARDVVWDLGSGDGRIVITHRRENSGARAVGYRLTRH